MIIYFTGTGNSLAAARAMADATGEELVDLRDLWKRRNFVIELGDGEALGFVFPVYRWTLPPLVTKYLEKATVVVDGVVGAAPAFCYTVITYGYFPGSEAVHLDRLLRDCFGFGLNASYHIRSVASCLYVSNPPATDRQRALISRADDRSQSIARAVAAGERSAIDRGSPLGRLLSLGTASLGTERSTKAFRVLEERCTGCGTCERICPTGSISLADGHPLWSGSNCTECLACVHRCPAEASQYGSLSKNRRRYVHPDLAR